MNRARLFYYLVFFLIALMPQAVSAQTSQEARVSGSPNPVGSGARALGMGGAFIGVADDATAASWNPGGLIQLETPEVSYVFSFDKMYRQRSFDDFPNASGEDSISLLDLNYFSFAYPFNWLGRNMIVSLNYQTLYSFNKEHAYNYNYHTESLNPSSQLVVIDGPGYADHESDGYLKALSPAIAVQITPTFSFGLTINWYHPNIGSKWERDINRGLEWIRTVDGTPVRQFTHQVKYYDKYEFKTSLNPFGFRDTSYTMGFLWNINSSFTLGGVYKSQFTAEIKYTEESLTYINSINLATGSENTVRIPNLIKMDQEMDMPASYGFGLCCRFSDRFSMDLDVYRTEWQHFVLRDENGRETSLITSEEISLTDTKPTHQVRLGAEYLFILKHKYVVPLRGGIFYDPEPTEEDPDTFYGVSLGGGIAVGSLVFDMAYQYRWGNGVRKIGLLNEDTYQDVEQHTAYASVIWHF